MLNWNWKRVHRYRPVYVYSSRRGSLLWNGEPVALAAIEAENRQWPAMNQEEMQINIRDRLSPGQALDEFVLAAISDENVRHTRTNALMAESLPFNFAGIFHPSIFD